MLIFNMKRVLALRGIERPFTFMVKNGFPTSSASLMLNYRQQNIRLGTLERLCRALSCTPNDLFEWRDDKDSTLAENHPLRSLKREAVQNKFNEVIKDLPLDKIGELNAFLDNLKKEDSKEE